MEDGTKVIIPDDDRILYFDRDRARFGFLSHFYPAPIPLDGEDWRTAEHYYQAQKSHDPAYRQAVHAAATPDLAKRMAARPELPKRVSRDSCFRAHGQEPRADWHEAKLDIMPRTDLTKFTQHLDLAERLLGTGTAVLIEDSPYEPFWGIGPDGQGLNWAGRVLMEVRAPLRGNPNGRESS